jgi:pimeloyl-ACP methyl ester carboxylesterase
MISWDEEFVGRLAARGLHVIRFDNRDIGLSTKFDELGQPPIAEIISRKAAPPYMLDDMAADAAGLLEALGIPAAHVVGVSMGGFIAQLLALNHPGKVLSLTSIMSGPGGADAVPPTPAALEVLLATPPTEREALIQHGMRVSRVISGPLFDEERALRQRTRAVDRSVSIAGTARQYAAIVGASSRIPRLAGLDLPVLVVHGEVDPLVPLENGRRTAAAVPGARLLTFAEMGHDLPPRIWPQVIDAIVEITRTPTTART